MDADGSVRDPARVPRRAVSGSHPVHGPPAAPQAHRCRGGVGGVMQLWMNYLDQILIFVVFALSLNVLLGYAGQVSVAQAAFGAIGGYSMGYLVVQKGW